MIGDEIKTIEPLGMATVKKYDKKILKYAEKYNVDPDLTRAVMYAENAKGYYGIPFDYVRVSQSVLPMNIQKNRWFQLVGKKPKDMYDPDVNIEAGTLLLSRIRDRIDKPTPEKIASVWHFMGAEETDDFGRYVGKVYREKPWRKID